MRIKGEQIPGGVKRIQAEKKESGQLCWRCVFDPVNMVVDYSLRWCVFTRG